MRQDDGSTTVVTRPVVVPSGQPVPTSVEELRRLAGLPSTDVPTEVRATAAAVEGHAAAGPVAWNDPADSLGRTLGVLGAAALGVGGLLLVLLRRRRQEDEATHG